MMEQQYFMLLATDIDDSHEARTAARPEHLARLQKLDDENRLLIAGPNPFPDETDKVSGSLIVAKFNSLDDAQTWAEAEPYAHAGVYEAILIKPFTKVFPY